MSDRPEPDDELDLIVSLPTVVSIIDAARAVGELQEEATNEEVQDEESPDDNDPDALTDTLKGLIEELNEDEQAALIALTWIGRVAGAVALAGDAAEYLTGMEMFGDLLSEGLAAFGVPAEEVGR